MMCMKFSNKQQYSATTNQHNESRISTPQFIIIQQQNEQEHQKFQPKKQELCKKSEIGRKLSTKKVKNKNYEEERRT